MTASSDQELELPDLFKGEHTPYSVMSDRLKQRTYGGQYLVADQDIFSDLQQYVGPSGPLRTSAFLEFAQNMSGFMSKGNMDLSLIHI